METDIQSTLDRDELGMMSCSIFSIEVEKDGGGRSTSRISENPNALLRTRIHPHAAAGSSSLSIISPCSSHAQNQEEEEGAKKRMQETQVNPMQEEKQQQHKKMRRGACWWLREQRVRDLVLHKRRLVQVPYTATVAHTVNALVANNVLAVPVAAPPGRWIGAGGSMILESDPATGAVRKQYIGMVTMLDVLVHIAEVGESAAAAAAEELDLEKKMSVPVYEVIGHTLEGLSLWTLNPNTSILDCMETFSKGVHRALVPLESHAENVVAAELTESSPGYRMLTQMDVLAFLREHANELKDVLPKSVRDLGAINENVFAVTKYTKVIEAIKSMRTVSLNAVPVVEDLEYPEDDQILQDGRGKRLVDTFSATDVRGCPVSQLQAWLSINVVEFKQKVSARASPECNIANDPGSTTFRKLVTCYEETNLGEVIDEAVQEHVHRVWVVDHEGFLQGLVSLTDMLRVIWEVVLHADRELQGVVSPSEQPR